MPENEMLTLQAHHRYLNSEQQAATKEQVMQLNHELRNAMSIILLTTDALRSELFGELTPAQQQALATLHSCALQIQTQLTAILQLLGTDEQSLKVG